MQPATAENMSVAFSSPGRGDRSWQGHFPLASAGFGGFTCHLCHRVSSWQISAPARSAAARAGAAAPPSRAGSGPAPVSSRARCASVPSPASPSPSVPVPGAAFQFPVSPEQSPASPSPPSRGWSGGAAAAPGAPGCCLSRDRSYTSMLQQRNEVKRVLKIKTTVAANSHHPLETTRVKGRRSVYTQIHLETEQTTPTKPIPGGKYFYI